MNNKLEVIGIDHGWSMMKTISQVFVTGVKSIVDKAKEKGRSALYRLSEFLGIKKRLLDIRENVRGASLMLCVPVWNRDKISYLAVPLGYRMWQKKESKLELAASMVRHVMPEFSSQKNVIILCDSWYTKQNLVSIVKEYPNLDLIENARADSIIYDPYSTLYCPIIIPCISN